MTRLVAALATLVLAVATPASAQQTAQFWEELGGSASGNGVSQSAAGVPTGNRQVSIAIGPDGTPYLAYQTTTTHATDFTMQSAGIHQWTNQVYVRRWSGSAWTFLGSGRDGGGASNALSFRVTGHGTTTFVSHNGEHPTLAIGADGRPVVAFIYSSWFEGGNPPEFNGENDDIYAVRWTGTAWQPLGPALPTTLNTVALGGPGGISNSPGWIREIGHDRLVRPWIMVDRDGAPVLAWGETNADDGFRYIYVHRFNGTTWQGLGSASGQIDKIAYAYDTALAQGVTGPVLVWPRGGGDLSWVAALEYDPGEGRWRTLGDGSVSPGISAPGDQAFNPRVAASSAGVPTVAWIDLTPAVPQAYLKTFDEGSGPDLSMSSVTAPASAQPGQSLTVTAIVRNGGTATAPASTVNFYLGTGTTHAAGDAALGSRPVPALGVGASATVELTAIVPAATPSGTWRVHAVVDEDGLVPEINEANNALASAPITVGSAPSRPDLSVTALTLPATGQTGRSLALGSTVKNIGGATAAGTTVRFYLSGDTTLDAGDVLLGSRVVGALAAGAASTAVTTVTIPANTSAPASYHVIAVADALGQVDETDEANNTFVSSATVAIGLYRPDLTLTALTMPATGATGRPLAISHTVKNAGPAPAGPFTVRFYLSGDGTLNGAVLLGARAMGGLTAGASSAAVATLTIPANTSAPASYHVVAVADALGQQTETDESNTMISSDMVAVSLYRPDLSITTLTTPATGAIGRALAVTNAVRNAGPAPAGPFTIRFYLSSDGTLDAGDVLLGSRAVGGLAAGATSRAVTNLIIPAATPAPATYQIVAVADALSQQVELNELDNAAVSAALTITPYRPDLGLTAPGIPASGVAGSALAISSTVKNVGPAPAGSFAIRFYLSSDGALDTGDVLLGSRPVGGLGAGASSTAVSRPVVPPGTRPGSYRVIAVVDADAQLTDAAKTVASETSVTITAP